MIISKTPFRISFFGGGTDYPVWYRENSGAVICTTINKYCYITCRYLPPFFDYKYRIRYYLKEETSSIDEIKHPSVRECLRFMGIKDGIEIVHTADLPAQSGLGSSSTFTVGMLHCLYTLRNEMPTKRQLALNALHVEQDMIKENVGSQDQTIAAFGGLNRIEFGGPQEITVQPIVMSQERLDALQSHLMLIFTGFSRNAGEIASEQIRLTPSKKTELTMMKEILEEAYKVITDKNSDLDEFGRLLHEQWRVKKSISPLISNSNIDEIYEAGMKAGALGGKLLGAGAGGFMLFYAKPEAHENIKESLKGFLHVPFYFEHLGSQIIYFTH
jgi:D-glycero-alpha-D-manno-heptose-7-phosphate kinase